MKTTLDIAALVAAVLYPLVLLVIVILYRKEIPLIARGLLGRVTKIGIAGISLEMAKADRFAPSWLNDTGMDLRHKAAYINVNDSTAGNFLAQLKAGGTADYAIVNLGTGREWLSSRLFIMAIIFERIKGVKAIVFLENTSDSRKTFIGWATPHHIRWALAQHFHWLETAFSEAYFNTITMSRIVSSDGRLGFLFDPANPSPGISLLQKYLQKIQSPPEIPPIAEEENEWVTLSTSDQIKEHALWLNATILEDLLGDVLNTENVNSESDISTLEHQIKQNIKIPHPFIAVLKENGRFNYLVKRDKLLEQILTTQ
jgi:hypothetical protein